MTKEEGLERHLSRVRRLQIAEDKRGEMIRIKDELVAEGFDEEIAKRACNEAWKCANPPRGKK